MTPRDPSRPDLSPEERDFVDKVRETYTWPEPSPAERAAFRGRLEERLQKPRVWRLASGPAWAAALAVAVVLLALWMRPQSEAPPGIEVAEVPQPAEQLEIAEPEVRVPAEVREIAETMVIVPAAPVAASGDDEVLLALTDLSSSVALGSSLPADYEAISRLFLGGGP